MDIQGLEPAIWRDSYANFVYIAPCGSNISWHDCELKRLKLFKLKNTPVLYTGRDHSEEQGEIPPVRHPGIRQSFECPLCENGKSYGVTACPVCTVTYGIDKELPSVMKKLDKIEKGLVNIGD